MKINHSKPYFDNEDSNSILRVLKDNFISSGKVAEELGKSGASCLGKQYGIATQSGTDALTAAFRVMNLPEGSEVAVPAYICSAPLDALSISGLRPVPVDIDKKNLAISIEKSNDGKKFPALLAAHLFGIPAPFHLLENENIIEDCAQTLGVEIDGRRIGSMGKFSTCSFYATKLLTTGHGGLVAVNDIDLYESMLKLMNHDKQEEWSPHLHFLMSDLNASLGITQLAKLDSMIVKRKDIASRFLKAMGNPGNISYSIYSRFLVISDGDIDDMINKFMQAGIEAKRPVHKPLFRYLGLEPSEFPNAQWAHDNIISVPIYPGLTEPEIDYIETFLENNKNELRCWPPA